MKKIILLLSVFCVSLQAQEKVFEISGGFSKKNNTKESYAIPNQVNDDIMLLFTEKKLVKGILLTDQYLLKSEINTSSIPSKYEHILGYNINDTKYSLFFTNNRNTRFGVQTFNFETLTSSVTLLDFKLKKETFIEVINYNNKFHLFSVSNNTPNMNVYTFDEDFTVHKNIIPLKHLEYIHPFDGSLIYPSEIFLYHDISKIESNNPNTIETTSKEIKIYQQDEKVIFCLDHRNDVTQLEYIDLNTFKLVHKEINKDDDQETSYKKNNSYIFDNKLFQIASSNQKMKFTITDLTTQKMIKEYKVSKKDTIKFKNSPIIQEGGGIFPALAENRVRKLEKTAKYLRKISSADIGISVYKVDNQYNVILGGTKEIETYNSFNFGNGFGAQNGFGYSFPLAGAIPTSTAFWVSFNPTFYNYNSYMTTKSTYINCLFDENFEHVKGDIPLNSFDAINDFEANLKNPRAITVFRHKQQLHYGYFDKKEKTYTLYKFEK